MVPLGALFFTDTDDVKYFIFFSNTDLESDREKILKIKFVYIHLASILELDANTQGRSQDFTIRGAIQTDNNNT